jgi:hypothetical protein
MALPPREYNACERRKTNQTNWFDHKAFQRRSQEQPGLPQPLLKIIYFNFTTTFKNSEAPGCHLKRNVGQ